MKAVAVKVKDVTELLEQAKEVSPSVSYVFSDHSGFQAHCTRTDKDAQITGESPQDAANLRLFHTQGSDVGFEGTLLFPEDLDLGVLPEVEEVPAMPSETVEDVAPPAKDVTPVKDVTPAKKKDVTPPVIS